MKKILKSFFRRIEKEEKTDSKFLIYLRSHIIVPFCEL